LGLDLEELTRGEAVLFWILDSERYWLAIRIFELDDFLYLFVDLRAHLD